MYPKLVPVGFALFRPAAPPSEPRSPPLYETGTCDFRPDRAGAACSARRDNPVAQLEDVHSVLRLNYETLRGLISLAVVNP